MNKENWRKRWLDSINELTSLELQRKSWLDFKNTNPHWSYVEFTGCYFDDLALSDKYKNEINIGYISEEEYELIKDWHKMLNEYEAPNKNSYDNEAILSDENWLKIINLGKKTKESLMFILNASEKQILQEQIKIT